MKHHAWQGQGKWWIGLAGLLLAALLLLPAVTAAQDDIRPDPDAPDQFVFLPFVQSGPAPEPVAGDVIPGQYIVVLQPPEVRAANNAGGQALGAAAIAAQVAEVFGGQILYTYESAIEGFAAVLPEDAVAELEQNPDIAYVEADRVITIVDTQLNPPWGLDRIDQRDRPLSGSYTYNAAGVGVHAYVIDTGIRSTHNEFGGRVSNGYTAIFDGRGTGDCNGHGTHVAGTVGGATYGVAKQVTLHPVRVLGCNGSGTTAGVIAGVDWVTANHTKPAVANMSLGGSASTSLDNAVRNSIAAGVTYALAAGNENANACLSSPARTAEALTVGASTSSDSRASFSNYGTCVDLFAPGSSILSAYYTSDSATATLSGTSMASPHVAGAAALYLSTAPNASPAQVAQALIDNASLNKLSSIGSGSPNRLLYTAFVGGGTPPTFTPTATSTPLPTATPTFTPTPLPTSTPTPTPTPTGQPTAQPTPTPTPTVTPTQPPVACTNLLQNGDFEQGRTVWSESSTHGYALICNQTSCGPAITAHRGQYLSWLGGANNEISEIRQPVTLPAGQNAYLSYWYDIESNDYCGYDYGYVRVIVDGVTRTLKRYSLCWSAETNGWANAQLDLSQYAGKTVTVVFRSTTDYSYSSSLFVDDVALTTAANCTAGLGPVEQVTELGGEDVSSAVAKPATPAGAAEHER